MNYIAQFHLYDSIPSIKAAFDEYPNTRVDFVHLSSDCSSEHRVTIYFWVESENPVKYVEKVQNEAPSVPVETHDERYGGVLASLTTNTQTVLDYLADERVYLHSSTGGPYGWDMVVSADDFESLAWLHEQFENEGYTMEIVQYMELRDESKGKAVDHLTEVQRETLRSAYQNGYFDEPRGITQQELATAFGISNRAMSKRLRSGVKKLVEASSL